MAGCSKGIRNYIEKSKGYKMSDMFPDREKAFEDKWAHDEELWFKVLARRNRLLGLWAAGEMGLSGPAAEAYAKAIVEVEISKDGDAAVRRKIQQDFTAAKIDRTEHLIERKLAECLEAAKTDLIRKG